MALHHPAAIPLGLLRCYISFSMNARPIDNPGHRRINAPDLGAVFAMAVMWRITDETMLAKRPTACAPAGLPTTKTTKTP